MFEHFSTSLDGIKAAREMGTSWRVLLLENPNDPSGRFIHFVWNPATSQAKVIVRHGEGHYENRAENRSLLTVREAFAKIDSYLYRGYGWSSGRTPTGDTMKVGSIKSFKQKLENSMVPGGTSSSTDPYDAIMRIVETDDDEWEAYDAAGSLVATMDKDGAYELYRERPRDVGLSSEGNEYILYLMRPRVL